MQNLSLSHNKLDKTMNSYLTDTANSYIVQSPITFEHCKKAFSTYALAVDCSPFICLREQCLLLCPIDFNYRLRSVLPPNHHSQFFTAVIRITDDVIGMKSGICIT
jgi:hypothetical protein